MEVSIPRQTVERKTNNKHGWYQAATIGITIADDNGKDIKTLGFFTGISFLGQNKRNSPSYTIASGDKRACGDGQTRLAKCTPRDESSIGPLQSATRLRGTKSFHIYARPFKNANNPFPERRHERPYTTLKWSLSPQELTATWWWRPPSDALPCEIPPGEIQMSSTEP